MPAGSSPLGFTYFAAVKFAGLRRPVSGSTAGTGSRREDRSLWVSPGRSLGIAAGFAFGVLALGFAVAKSERAPLSADGNPEVPLHAPEPERGCRQGLAQRAA
jgi:hypothetical protein